jgi:hypothetical protein
LSEGPRENKTMPTGMADCSSANASTEQRKWDESEHVRERERKRKVKHTGTCPPRRVRRYNSLLSTCIGKNKGVVARVFNVALDA